MSNDIVFSATFDPSPVLAEAAALYARYCQTALAVPFDREACESAYSDWAAAMEAIHPCLAPKTVMYAPRPPGVTDEEIAEVGAALARGYWPVT